MDLMNLQVIDWEQATRLAGNQKDFAKELLGMLVKNLNKDIAKIKYFNQQQNYIELLKQVHKLHGALCYCGVPRLKTLVARLERELKNNIMDEIATLLSQLDTEVYLLLEQYTYHDH